MNMTMNKEWMCLFMHHLIETTSKEHYISWWNCPSRLSNNSLCVLAQVQRILLMLRLCTSHWRANGCFLTYRHAKITASLRQSSNFLEQYVSLNLLNVYIYCRACVMQHLLNCEHWDNSTFQKFCEMIMLSMMAAT